MASKTSVVRKALRLCGNEVQALFDQARTAENKKRLQKGKPLLARIKARSLEYLPDWVVRYAKQLLAAARGYAKRRRETFARAGRALQVH